MNPEHAKSLTPKHVRLDAHELDRMAPETLAAIMARWPPNVSDYFRLKYADQQALRPTVFEWLESQTKEVAIAEDWPLGKYHRLIDLAIDEALVSGNCGTCGGDGTIPRSGRSVTCSRCGGTGRTRYTQWRRAKRLGVNQSDWSRRWSLRYERITRLIDWAEGIITYRR